MDLDDIPVIGADRPPPPPRERRPGRLVAMVSVVAIIGLAVSILGEKSPGETPLLSIPTNPPRAELDLLAETAWNSLDLSDAGLGSLAHAGGVWLAAVLFQTGPLWRSEDGMTWRPVYPADLVGRSIDRVEGDGSGGFVVSAGNGLAISGDGIEWRLLETPWGNDGFVADLAVQDDMIVTLISGERYPVTQVAGDGEVWVSEDRGGSWSRLTTGEMGPLTVGVVGGEAIVGGFLEERPAILKASGGSPVVIAADHSQAVKAIIETADGNMVAATGPLDFPAISRWYRSTDQGWTMMEAPGQAAAGIPVRVGGLMVSVSSSRSTVWATDGVDWQIIFDQRLRRAYDVVSDADGNVVILTATDNGVVELWGAAGMTTEVPDLPPGAWVEIDTPFDVQALPGPAAVFWSDTELGRIHQGRWSPVPLPPGNVRVWNAVTTRSAIFVSDGERYLMWRDDWTATDLPLSAGDGIPAVMESAGGFVGFSGSRRFVSADGIRWTVDPENPPPFDQFGVLGDGRLVGYSSESYQFSMSDDGYVFVPVDGARYLFGSDVRPGSAGRQSLPAGVTAVGTVGDGILVGVADFGLAVVPSFRPDSLVPIDPSVGFVRGVWEVDGEIVIWTYGSEGPRLLRWIPG